MSRPVIPLSFTLKRALTPRDMSDVCQIRRAAYGRHLPQWESALGKPDAMDTRSGTIVMLCRDKFTHTPIGTARLQFTEYGPLPIDQALTYPTHLARSRRAEVTRLAVMAGADKTVKLALMKACYLLCLLHHIRFLIVGARCEALIRSYKRLGFQDVFSEHVSVPLAHAGGMAHRILSLNVEAVFSQWVAAQHPWLAFMTDVEHPDIQVCTLGEHTMAQAA